MSTTTTTEPTTDPVARVASRAAEVVVTLGAIIVMALLMLGGLALLGLAIKSSWAEDGIRGVLTTLILGILTWVFLGIISAAFRAFQTGRHDKKEQAARSALISAADAAGSEVDQIVNRALEHGANTLTDDEHQALLRYSLDARDVARDRETDAEAARMFADEARRRHGRLLLALGTSSKDRPLAG